MTIIVFLGILTVLVLVHELGHFSIAKLFSVRVLEFGLGYPPRLFKVTFGETIYSLNLLPLGGFVRMLGEEESDAPGSFSQKNPWQRLAILSAGSLMNLILPFFLFLGAFAIPHSILQTDVVILEVASSSPAEKAGLLKGDIVREIQGEVVVNSNELLTFIQSNLNQTSNWIVERNQTLVEVYIPKIRTNPPENEGPVGIQIGNGRVYLENIAKGSDAEILGFKNNDLILKANNQSVLNSNELYRIIAAATNPFEVLVLREGILRKIKMNGSNPPLDKIQTRTLNSVIRHNSITEAAALSIDRVFDIFSLIHREISSLLSGSSQLQLTGPVGIAKITGDVAKSGINSLMLWAGILSINLAILNLLPIPALDGGRIVFVLFELVSGGRRLAPRSEKLIHLVGFLGLIGLILIITVNDIQRIIGPT